MTVKHATHVFGALLVTLSLMTIVGLAYALRPRDDQEFT